jgi:hypothetical protein
MELTKRFIMNKAHIGLFKAVMESYEYIGIFSVLDGKRGLIELIYPSNFETEVRSIIEDMSGAGILFEEVFDV